MEKNSNLLDKILDVSYGWEYSTLRNEILRRIELRQQITTATLTFAGVLLSVGLSTPSVALIYPPLATFLAIGWMQNDLRVKELATYIRKNLENIAPGLGWETYVQKTRKKHGIDLGDMSFYLT